MSSEEFLTFRKFDDEAGATELSDFLKQHGIDCVNETEQAGVPALTYGDAPMEYLVKLRPEDFETAEKLLLALSSQQIETVEEDHYLFDFSDEELMEILTKPDEWGEFDYTLAQKILKERGKEVSEERLQQFKADRLGELAKPAPANSGLIIAGYIFALIGGAIGIFIGWYLKTHKKVLPNGDEIYAFSDADRKKGSQIFVLGLVITILVIIAQLIRVSTAE